MKSRIILIFYLLIYTLSGKAQSISFLHLTTDDGLPNNSISSIYQDEREFMWFGTVFVFRISKQPKITRNIQA